MWEWCKSAYSRACSLTSIQGILTHPGFSQALGLLTVLLAALQDALKTVCIKLLNPSCATVCGENSIEPLNHPRSGFQILISDQVSSFLGP